MAWQFQQIAPTTPTQLTIPHKTIRVRLKAATQNIRFKMDGNQPTASEGELLLAAGEPQDFQPDDLKNAWFIEAAGGATLAAHYLISLV